MYKRQIVETEGMKLLDGGCTDSIPVKKFQQMGYQKNIVVLTPVSYTHLRNASRYASITDSYSFNEREARVGQNAVTPNLGYSIARFNNSFISKIGRAHV